MNQIFLVFLFSLIYNNAMTQNLEKYKVVLGTNIKTLYQDYIYKEPIYIDCYPEPRGSYSIYRLSDSSYLAISSGFREDYPALVFSDFAFLKDCIVSQKFPVPENYLTFLEKNDKQVLDFLKNEAFFKEVLKNKLGNEAIWDDKDFKHTFTLIYEYVNDKRNSKSDKEAVVVSFVMLFLKEALSREEFEICFLDYYGVFNRYYLPVIKNNKVGKQPFVFGFSNINPIEHAWISLAEKMSQKSYDNFCNSVGIAL